MRVSRISDMPDGTIFVSHLFLKKKVIYYFDEDMARKSAILQPLNKETIGASYEGFTKLKIAYGNRSTRVMTMSMARPVNSSGRVKYG